MRVLAVDDDMDIVSTLMDHLDINNIQADCAYSGRQALALFDDNEYDVIILDVMMPNGDGYSTCKALRRLGCTSPVLFLTARDTLDDKLAGFESGADDYLVKPFHMSELICRVKALAKRVSKQKISLLECGDLQIDIEQKWARRGGAELKLSPVHFKIIQTLMLQFPKLVTREQLTAELWGDNPPETDSLRSLMYQLRQILNKPFTRPILETVRGQGFRLKPA